MSPVLLLILGLLAPRASAAPVHAFMQASSATLTGIVVDETDGAIYDAQVVATNVASALERRTTTDRSGAFVFAFLPPGQYVITAERSGFVQGSVTNLFLNVNDQVSLRIRLKVQGASESVSVVAEPGRASVTAGVGTVVNRHFVANMPLNGRSLQSLIQLVPGVVLTSSGIADGGATGGAAQFSINGQRATANYFMVDGVSANTGIGASSNVLVGASGSGQSPGTTALGGTSSLVSLDALQEFRIDTSAFAPEFGRTPGGQISLVTRSGTNQWHGTVSEYFRHDVFDANDWFANSRELPKAKLRQNLFGGVLGGPIQRNRVFVFASYEGLRLQQPRTTVVSVPTVELRAQATPALRPYLDALPLPNGRSLSEGVAEFGASYSDRASFDASSFKVDGHVTTGVMVFARGSHTPSHVDSRVRALSTMTALEAENSAWTYGTTWVVGSRVTADGRINWSRNATQFTQSLNDFGGARVPDASQIFAPGRDPSSAQFNFPAVGLGFVWGSGTADIQRQFNAVGTVAWAARSHHVKLGVDYRRMVPTLGGYGAAREVLQFPTVQSILQSRATNYTITAADPQPREASFSNLSLYLQDTWHLTHRATLTYGLRFERVPPPTESSGRPPQTVLGIDASVLEAPRLAPSGTPLWRGRTGEVAPRIGGSLRLRTKPRWETTVRGAFGTFHDLGLGSIASAFQDIYPFFSSVNRANVAFPLSSDNRTPPRLGIDPPGQFYLLDPNLRLPYTLQWNVACEQAIGSAQTVTVTYVGALGHRLLLLQGYLQPLADWPTVRTRLNVQRPIGESRYSSLQVQFQRELRRGLRAMVGYTLAQARDNGSSDGALAPPVTLGSIFAQEWAASDFDVRHLASAALSYEVPSLPHGVPLGIIGRDWGLDLLVRAQSALPLTPLALQVTVDGALFNPRPDRVPGEPLYIQDPSMPTGRRLNPAAFQTPSDTSRQGTFERNRLRGLPASQVDFAVRRQFPLGGTARLQIRLEFFNLFNHPNFGAPSMQLADPQFGRTTQMLNRSLGGLSSLYQIGGPRSGQFAVKVLF